MAYAGPKIPPNPPVLPSERSIYGFKRKKQKILTKSSQKCKKNFDMKKLCIEKGERYDMGMKKYLLRDRWYI